MGFLPLMEDNAEPLCSTLMDWLWKMNVQCRKLVGMEFDGAATFAGAEEDTPHALFHCHCHRLQLVIVQATSCT